MRSKTPAIWVVLLFSIISATIHAQSVRYRIDYFNPRILKAYDDNSLIVSRRAYQDEIRIDSITPDGQIINQSIFFLNNDVNGYLYSVKHNLFITTSSVPDQNECADCRQIALKMYNGNGVLQNTENIKTPKSEDIKALYRPFIHRDTLILFGKSYSDGDCYDENHLILLDFNGNKQAEIELGCEAKLTFDTTDIHVNISGNCQCGNDPINEDQVFSLDSNFAQKKPAIPVLKEVNGTDDLIGYSSMRIFKDVSLFNGKIYNTAGPVNRYIANVVDTNNQTWRNLDSLFNDPMKDIAIHDMIKYDSFYVFLSPNTRNDSGRAGLHWISEDLKYHGRLIRIGIPGGRITGGDIQVGKGSRPDIFLRLKVSGGGITKTQFLRINMTRFDPSSVHEFSRSEPDVQFYPNPASEFVTIDMPYADGNLQIINATGKLVRDLTVTQNQQLDVSQLGSGMYFFRFTNQDRSVTKKMVIR
jgi:hypothetical protein